MVDVKSSLDRSSPAEFDDAAKNFIIEDYKLKINYLTSHFTRMWTRFNFFLTIELALFGFLGYLLFDPARKNLEATVIPIILGVGSSLLWYVIGAQDRFLVVAYRNAVRSSAVTLSQMYPGLSWYKEHYVSTHSSAAHPYDEQGRERGVFSWYTESISITRIAAIFPLMLFLLWLVILVLRYKRISMFS